MKSRKEPLYKILSPGVNDKPPGGLGEVVSSKYSQNQAGHQSTNPFCRAPLTMETSASLLSLITLNLPSAQFAVELQAGGIGRPRVEKVRGGRTSNTRQSQLSIAPPQPTESPWRVRRRQPNHQVILSPCQGPERRLAGQRGRNVFWPQIGHQVRAILSLSTQRTAVLFKAAAS